MARMEVILSAHIDHEYFGGAARSLRIEALSDTKQLMKRYALKMKASESGLELLATKAGKKNSVPLESSGLTLEFALFSEDPQFLFYTDLPGGGKGSVAFYSNEKSPVKNATLRQSALPWQGKRAEGLFGLIRIIVAPTLFRKPKEIRYRIGFEGLSAQWKYYYVGPLHFSDPEIEHDDIQFQKAPIKQGEAIYRNDSLARSLVSTFPEAQHWVFASKEKVPWRAKPYDHVKLMRDGEVVIPHLPNPRKENRGLHIINAL